MRKILVELTHIRSKWGVPRQALRWESKTAFAYYNFAVFDVGKWGERKSIKYRFMGKNLPMSRTQIFDYITIRKRLLLRSSVCNYTVKKFLWILLTPSCYYRIKNRNPWHFSPSSERLIQSVLSCTHSAKFTVMPASKEIRSLAKWLFRFAHQKPTCICIFSPYVPHTLPISSSLTVWRLTTHIWFVPHL